MENFFQFIEPQKLEPQSPLQKFVAVDLDRMCIESPVHLINGAMKIVSDALDDTLGDFFLVLLIHAAVYHRCRRLREAMRRSRSRTMPLKLPSNFDSSSWIIATRL